MKRTIRIILHLIVFILVFVAWGQMFFGDDGMLSTGGIRGLKYFTVLSNLFAGVMSFVCAIRLLRGGKEAKVPRRLALAQFASVVAVGLTFFVVMVFLGPIFGYGKMLDGANFFLHLIIPLLAIGEYICFEHDTMFTIKETLWCVVPMAAYGIVYTANILINGIGEGKSTNDWYGFTLWGLEWAGLIFIVVALVTWGIGLVLWKLNEVVQKNKKDKTGGSCNE